MKTKFPVQKSKTNFSFVYDNDLTQAYAFYCARYRDISFEEFMHMGITEFMMKFNSMPETEPLYKIIKSRAISLSAIKDKDERKYWGELKRANKIPDLYIDDEEINRKVEEEIRKNGEQIKQSNN